MQPPRILPRTGGFAIVGIGISPLSGQRPVEPLDLAFGLRPMRTGEHVLDLLGGEHGVEQPRPVYRAVIGHQPADVDVVAGEVAPGPVPKPSNSDFAVVIEDFRVRQARAVVDDVVQVGVANGGVTLGLVVSAAEYAPAAAVGDAGEFLDVHVDHVAQGVTDIESVGVRRTSRPVAWSRQTSAGMRYRRSTRWTVERAMPR